MQNFGATIKKHYGMLWYFLEWPIRLHENDSTVHVSSEMVPAGYPNKNSNKDFFFCRLALRKHVSTQKATENTKLLRRSPEGKLSLSRFPVLLWTDENRNFLKR